MPLGLDAMSSDEEADIDIDHEAPPAKPAAKLDDQANGTADEAVKEAAEDQQGGDDGSDDDDDANDGEEEEEEEFIVEAILDHKFVKESPEPFYRIKWEGFDQKKDLTWEPQKNLFPAAKQLLAEYHHKIGGAPQPGGVKKRKSTASLKDSTPDSKRAKTGSSAEDDEVDTDQGYTPKGSDWDKFVKEVETIERDGRSEKLLAMIAWQNGKRSKIGLEMCYKKLPQSMLKFYEAHLKFNS